MTVNCQNQAMEMLDKQLSRLGNALRLRMEHRLTGVEFGPKAWTLPNARVCVMEPKRSRLVLGWHSAGRWSQGVVNLDEIVLTPNAVSKGVYHAADVLAHELVHLANAVAKRVDTSRQGRYHNDNFRETAEAVGLVVARHRTYGWCDTQLGAELKHLVRKLLQDGVVSAHVFKYQRHSTRVRGSLVKMTASCGVFAYVTHSNAESVTLRCGRCGEILKPASADSRRD